MRRVDNDQTSTSSTSTLMATINDSPKQKTEQTEEELESTPLELAFYLSGGFSCFVVMYCMMAISAYNEEAYGNKGYLAMVFAANLGGFSAFLFTKKLMAVVDKKHALIGLPIFNFLIILMLVLVGKYEEDQESLIKVGANLVGNYLFGVSLFILRYVYSKMVFKRGATPVAFFNAGMPVAGICTTGIGILQTLFLPEKSLYFHAICYVGFQVICLIFIIGTTITYFNLHESSNDDTYSLASPGSPGSPSSPTKSTTQEPQPGLIKTTGLIYPMMFSTFFSWAVTMMILPNLIWALGLGWSQKHKDMELLVILMVYVLFDFTGRLSYSKFAFESTMLCHLLGLLRVVFIAIPILAFTGLGIDWLKNRLVVTIPFTILHALLTGYMSSSQMHITARRVAKRHKENAAYLVTLSMLFGQMYGSLANLAGLDVQLK